jgi:hypothetical protein
LTDNFEKWLPLRALCIGDLPCCGGCCAVYAFRDSRTGAILKFGETGQLRRRIFANFIGGQGGGYDEATTKRIHRYLFSEGMIDHVEIAWIEVQDKAAARLKEKKFRRDHKAAHGRWPDWDRQD